LSGIASSARCGPTWVVPACWSRPQGCLESVREPSVSRPTRAVVQIQLPPQEGLGNRPGALWRLRFHRLPSWSDAH
jgi:hypothetical protein